MALFGRRKNVDGDEADAEVPAQDEAAPVERALPPRPQGPWDSHDLPADDKLERIDLGALQVHVPEGVELRVDLDPAGAIVAATLVHGEDVMQLGIFAAPRTEPIWDEVRAEIITSLREGGGGLSEVAGAWGTELFARLPTDQPGVFAPARFIGVNGPRWFLRALISGPSAIEGADNAALSMALRTVVVVRGVEAMPPREGLGLRLPKEAQASADEAIAEQGRGALTTPPERGPEITETR